MGISLGTMVANLSAHKRGWDDRWEEFSAWAEKGMDYQNTLLDLVDEDTNAFNKIMDAFRLPKDTDKDKDPYYKSNYSALGFVKSVKQQLMKNGFTHFTYSLFAVLNLENPL